MSVNSPTSRRAVLAASAWSVPTVLVASAAPAFAASCKVIPYTMNWGGSGWTYVPTNSGSPYAAGTGTGTATATTTGMTPGQLADIQPLIVTGTSNVPTSGSDNLMRGLNTTYNHDNNNSTPNLVIQNMRVSSFNVGNSGAPGLTLAQDADGNVGNNSNARRPHHQQITLSFNRPVSNLAFTLSDLDQTSNNHIDKVELSGGIFTFTRPGDGTVTGNGVYPAAGAGTGPWTGVTNLANEVTGTQGNVNITFGATPISSVAIRFWNDVNNAGQQWIFISRMTFNASSC